MGLEEGTNSGEGTWCREGIKCFNNEPVDNGFGYECMNDSGDGSSGSRIKLDSLFHLSLMNSRTKDKTYEQSPMLFSSNIQHIGCSGVVVEEEKREKVPSFSNDIAMALIEEELG
ncbi:hypothetical protein V6N11_049963 [Hibiscus sabdariffa]|uniref:Uncharacterized protein n=1 Tax=Hibiscus sabdariffa TaxID=183260 RepID=A0ABR2T8K7_9ROSI